jgi:hypothetical protein
MDTTVARVSGHAHAGIAWGAKIAISGIIELLQIPTSNEADMKS